MSLEINSSSTDQLTRLLEEMNKEGTFLISVVTDQNGLPIVFAAQEGFDPDRQSAIVAMLQKTLAQTGKRLGMLETSEISLFDANGHHLICRPFKIKDLDLTLAVLTPTKSQSYRRITSRAINQMRRVWSARWK